MSLSVLLTGLLVGGPQPITSSPPAEFRLLESDAAVAAEPGLSLVALPNDGGRVVVNDRGVAASNVEAKVPHDTEILVRRSDFPALTVAAETLAGLAADNPRRAARVSDLYAETPRFGGPEVRVARWYLTVTDARPLPGGAWELHVFPSGALLFGSGDFVAQRGQYRPADREDGSGSEVWRLAPDGDLRLVRPAAGGDSWDSEPGGRAGGTGGRA